MIQNTPSLDASKQAVQIESEDLERPKTILSKGGRGGEGIKDAQRDRGSRTFSRKSLRAYLKRHLPPRVRVSSEAVTYLELMLETEVSHIVTLSAHRLKDGRGQDLTPADLEHGLHLWKARIVEEVVAPVEMKLSAAVDGLRHMMLYNQHGGRKDDR